MAYRRIHIPDIPKPGEPHHGKFVSYLRVSTPKQGRSGLGEEAQRDIVKNFLDGGRWELVEEFVEVESGKRSDRPKLALALASAKKHKAKLIIAKLDRLARDAKLLLTLVDDGAVDIVFCDLPQVPPGPLGRFFISLMACVAEFEAGLISERTRNAMKAAKARLEEENKQFGTNKKFGNPMFHAEDKSIGRAIRAKGAKVNRDRAAEFARKLLPVIDAIERAGAVSLRQIAAELTLRQIKTPSGGETWNPVTVSKIKRRAKEQTRRP